MAIYTKRGSTWIPSDGEAIALERSVYATAATHTDVGYNPANQTSGAGGTGWYRTGSLVSGLTIQNGPDLVTGAGLDRLMLGSDADGGKPGIWLVTASASWEAGAISTLLMRADRYNNATPPLTPLGQASSYVPAVTTAGSYDATVTLTFMADFADSTGLDGVQFRVCTVAGTPQSVKNIKVRAQWLSHALNTAHHSPF